MSAPGSLKGFFIIACLLVGIAVQGCRYTVVSWGSKSEPDKIALSTVTPTTTFSNRYVEFTDCVPLVEFAECVKGTCYVPLVPADAEPVVSNGKPTRPSGYYTRVIVKVSSNDLDRLVGTSTCRGLISGTCERDCHITARNAIPKRLGMPSIDAMPTLAFGQAPSLMMGLLMLAGSFGSLIVLGWVVMKSNAD